MISSRSRLFFENNGHVQFTVGANQLTEVGEGANYVTEVPAIWQGGQNSWQGGLASTALSLAKGLRQENESAQNYLTFMLFTENSQKFPTLFSKKKNNNK